MARKDPKRPVTANERAISGAIAGLLTRIVIAPLDVIKIRLQMHTSERNFKNVLRPLKDTKFKSLFGTTKFIIKQEGVLALWKGNLPASWLYLCYGGIQFYSYHQLKHGFIMNGWFPAGAHAFLSGAISGVFATIGCYPLDLLRTRLAVQGNTIFYSGLIDAIKTIRQTEGIKGFYRGIYPSVISIIPQMGLTFHFHELYTNIYNKTVLKMRNDWLIEVRDLVTGGAAGVTSKIIVMPLDVIRKRLQVQGPVRTLTVDPIPVYSGTFNVAVQMARREGYLAFFKGLWPTLLKAASSSAGTFFVVGAINRHFENN